MDTTNCKNNINTKYNNVVDHVYCHANNENNYIRSNNAGTTMDIMTLLKENKQLKAMLLLHLDLIQEQSDQLLAKDKLLAGLKENNDLLRKQIENYEKSTCCNESGSTGDKSDTMMINNNGRNGKKFNVKNTISSELQQVKKIIQNRIEEKKENMLDYKNNNVVIVNNPIKVVSKKASPNDQISTDKKDKNILNSIVTRSKQSPSPPLQSTHQQQNHKQQKLVDLSDKKYKIYDENPANCSSIIGQSNGKLISKIILHRVQIPGNVIIPKKENMDEDDDDDDDDNDMENEFDDFTDEKPTIDELKQENVDYGICKPGQSSRSRCSSDNSDSNPTKSSPNESPSTVYNENLDLSLNMFDDDVTIKNETFTDARDLLNDQKLNTHTKTSQNKLIQEASNNKKKCSVITTRTPYSIREWIDTDISPEEWSNKEEAEALKSEEPMLEIPKWSIKEFSALYSIEGTEDLSDDIFMKRHAKLEHDEKRRKKWDAQRIREQRTIERLKRRHCKDELQEIDNPELLSFYSTPDTIKFIQITDELPVQAFGEGIPRLNYGEFHLPWMHQQQHTRNQTNEMNSNSNNNISLFGGGSSTAYSSFVFLKKRRRQQSISVNNGKRKASVTATSSTITMSNLATELNVSNTFTPTKLNSKN